MRDEVWYEAKAEAVQAYLQAALGERPYVPYMEVGGHLGVDRFTLAWVLGTLVRLNTERGEPLWSSLVAYKRDMTVRGRVRFYAGEPGDSFFECAAEQDGAWNVSDRAAFLCVQRVACYATLGRRPVPDLAAWLAQVRA